MKKKVAGGVLAALFIVLSAAVGLLVERKGLENFNLESQIEAVRQVPSSSFAVEDAPQRADGKVNINTASVRQLMTLDGIGAGLAQRIIDYRVEEGPFEVPEDLMKVSGIGSKKFAQIRDVICVE